MSDFNKLVWLGLVWGLALVVGVLLVGGDFSTKRMVEHVLLSIFLSLYLSSIVYFSFMSHPIGYCLLLLFSSLVLVSWAYLLASVSWYIMLFCLVYMGGVYILFVFTALQNPNSSPYCGSGGMGVFFVFFLFLMFYPSGCLGKLPVLSLEWGHYLCSWQSGNTYLLFCFILVFGFFILSLVGSVKDSFFR